MVCDAAAVFNHLEKNDDLLEDMLTLLQQLLGNYAVTAAFNVIGKALLCIKNCSHEKSSILQEEKLNRILLQYRNYFGQPQT